MRLTLDEITNICGLGPEQMKSLRRRGQFGRAFGANTAFASDWYLPVDAVGVMLTAGIAQAYDMTTAAQITRAFGDAWLAAVAAADADTEIDSTLAVADLIRKDDGQRALLAWCAGHAVTALAMSPESNGYTVERVTVTNISSIVRAVRANAARLDLDLSAPFMPAPGSDDFQEIVAPYAAIEAGPVEVRALKKAEAAARRLGEQARALMMRRRGSGQMPGTRGLQPATAA
jgi:hypothetical protein